MIQTQTCTQFNSKPCNKPECPLFHTGIYVPSVGKGSIMIIGEQPGHEDAAKREPFSGPTGNVLQTVFHLTKLKREDFYITNVVKCYGAYRGEEAALLCKEFLEEEVKNVQPKFVLNLGSTAQECIDNRKIHTVRGFVRSGTFAGVTFTQLGTFNPASCFRTAENFDLVVKDFEKFQRVISGKYQETPIDFEVILDRERFEEVVQELLTCNATAVDIETESFEIESQILCTTLTSRLKGKVKSFVIPFNDELNPILKKFLNSSVTKIGQNISFDVAHLIHAGIGIKGPFFDTMIAHYLISTYLPHDLNTIATIYTDVPEWETSIRDLIGFGKKAHFTKLPKELLYRYTAIDGIATYLSAMKLKQELRVKNRLEILEHLMVTLPTLAEIRLQGVQIDIEKLPLVQRTLDNDILKARHTVYELAGHEFNINSPKQLSKVLFEDLKLRPLKRTKTGFSTDVDTLETLLDDNPEVIQSILDFRSLTKLRSTFVPDDLIEKLDKHHRLHTTYKPTGTRTLRLSSENPNLQNIPRLAYIRQLFCAPPDYVFIEADYSLAELRVAAYLAKDIELIKALNSKEDVHRVIAGQIFRKLPSEVTTEERVMAKFVVYGILYGRGPESIAAQFKITYERALLILDSFLKAYPALDKWMHIVVQNVCEHRLIVTPYGFVRQWPVFGDFLPDWEREARNLLPQSIVACKTIESMNVLHNAFKELKLRSRVVLNIHDSLCFESPNDEKLEVIKMIKAVMESPVKNLELKIPCDIKVGDCWWADKYFAYEEGNLVPKERKD